MSYARTLNRPTQRKSEVKKFAAPLAGWISNRALAVPSGDDGNLPSGAMVLDNFIPRATSVTLRRGKLRYCTLGDGTQAAVSIFSYNNGLNKKLFAATATTIYDITDVEFATDSELVDEDDDAFATEDGDTFGWSSTQFLSAMGGFTGGDWSVVQFATTGGVYLIGVNGQDTGFIYDGEHFFPYIEGGVETLLYDALVDDFTIGDVVTGGASGATATIWNIEDLGGGEGILYLTGVTGGPFDDNETITDVGGGEATANGVNDPLIPGIIFDTGVTSADMSFVWVYRNRLYFAETGSMNAWYLDIDSVGGDADKFPLAGIFGLGGSLLFGQRWSLSSGGDGGLSEQNVFISTEGEVAVFQGLGPDDPATWSQQGLYRIGRPLGKRAFIRGAGDLAIATSVGLVPLSKAIELDLTALTVASISYPIADAWRDALNQRGDVNWQGQIWPDQKLAVFSPPTSSFGPVMFVANTETGAWGRVTGWEGLCFDVFGGRLFFGESNGAVYIANETGLDDGAPYSGACLPLYDDLGSPSSRKIAKVGRYVLRASVEVQGRVTWQSDYNEQLPPSPDAESIGGDPSIWGIGIWGSSVWLDTLPRLVVDRWVSLGGSGYTVSVAFQVTSGSLQPLDVEVLSGEVTYETATVIS